MIFPYLLWKELDDHLFPGDHDEHGAVVLAGQAVGRNGPRLLVREVLKAVDGRDYVPGERGYRALSPTFIASAARRARDEGWVYLAVHCHGGRDRVAFSSIDQASHARGYPALQQITGRPVGAIVVARGAVAGDIWVDQVQRADLSSTTVLGSSIVMLTPSPPEAPGVLDSTFDRQARLFGADGQRRLSSIRVAVVGLGGAGSMATEMLARLGVGELVLIDPDRLEISNLTRVVGSRRSDLNLGPSESRWPRWLRREQTSDASLKVDIAARAIADAGLSVEVTTLPKDVGDRRALEHLISSDWIVLSADSQRARHFVNLVAHAYLIPVVQLGVKVAVNQVTGEVGDIFTVARRVLPDSGCLWCNGLIDPTQLQLESLGEEGDRARAYVGPDAPAPSVISLNGLAVAAGVTDLLLATVGLANPSAGGYLRNMVRTGHEYIDEPRRDPACPYCGTVADSLLARGDAASIPGLRQT